jgi:lipid kinase YegS
LELRSRGTRSYVAGIRGGVVSVWSPMFGHIHVVSSRKAVGDAALDAALEELSSPWTSVVRSEVGERDDARAIAREAARRADVVVAAGGDGTVNDVASGVLDSREDCVFAVLPYGTANDFAVGLGIPSEPRAALRDLADGETVAIDVGRVNGRWFVNVAAAGFGAQMTAETPREAKDMFGPLAYVGHALAHLGRIATPEVEIRAPGLEWKGNCLGWIVANGRQTGGGYVVAPNAELDDGRLDLLIIPELTAAEVVAIAARTAVTGGPGEGDPLVTAQVPWVEVRCAAGMAVNVDGETLHSAGEALDLRIEVVPRALRLIRPRRRQAVA